MIVQATTLLLSAIHRGDAHVYAVLAFAGDPDAIHPDTSPTAESYLESSLIARR